MKRKRKICVLTGTRAEYGLLYWLLREIKEDPELKLQLIVTGAHLSPEFGLTYKVIEADGFVGDEKVEMLLSGDTPVAIAKSIGLAVIGIAEALDRLKPDILVLVGDRYEVLAAAQAAMVTKIPIAHIHGGEATEGLIDEAIRHAVTKMAHLHFVAAEPYRKRVIQLGENPKTVFNFGAPGLDNIKKLNLLSREDFEKAINFHLGESSFLVTYHPLTLSKKGPEIEVREVFKALDHFKETKIIFTKQNSDTEGRVIGKMIDEYARSRPDRVKVFITMGQLSYLSAMRQVNVVIGNSSSGIIEAPVLKKATVNIGDRQRGRLKACSIIDCEEKALSIIKAIRKALSPEFQRSLQHVVSFYGTGNASRRIKEKLKTYDLNGIIFKHFYNLKVPV